MDDGFVGLGGQASNGYVQGESRDMIGSVTHDTDQDV